MGFQYFMHTSLLSGCPVIVIFPRSTPLPWLAILLGFGWFIPSPGLHATTNLAVVALGRLEPASGMTRVAVPYSMQGPAVISTLLVDEGDMVNQGAVLARTHMNAVAAAAVVQAEAEIAVRESRLALVEAGLKPSEIAALAAETERERSELAEAEQLFQRATHLREGNAISAQELDSARTRWLSASNRVTAATQRLAAGAEVRAIDVALARAEIAVAQAVAQRARRESELTEIRAPFAGEVMEVLAKEGEMAGTGLLDLGRTDTMEVRAEVYESDIRHVSMDQRAEIRGDAFPGALAARVKAIGRQVRPNRLLQPDPAAFADNRVVEVILSLEQPPPPGLSGALVHARFLP